jgi:hypothetical protein
MVERVSATNVWGDVRKTAEKIGRSWPLVVACILHATTFALIRDRQLESVPPLSETQDAPIDISLEESTRVATSEPAPITRVAIATTIAHARSVAPESSGAISEAESIVAPPLDSSIPLVRPLPGDDQDGTWTFRSSRGPIDLKLGDKTGSLGRQMAANGQLELPPKKSAAGMTEGLDAIDVQNGFGRAGGVVQAIEAVVRDPAAPPEGVAFFDVAIEKNGNISVSVSETTANREEWERLTSAIASSLKTKNVRFPDQGKGLKIGVRVEAKIRYPDGRDPKKNGTYAQGTGLKAHTDKDGLVLDELPSLSIGARGKVCSGAISLTMLGPSISGGCEPANIGTHAERTLAAHETYEQRM